MIPEMTDATGSILSAGYRAVRLTVYGLRWVAFAVLATFEPLVRITFSLLALAGFLTCILFRVGVHAPHFPLTLMLTFSIVTATLSVLYGFLVQKLRP